MHKPKPKIGPASVPTCAAKKEPRMRSAENAFGSPRIPNETSHCFTVGKLFESAEANGTAQAVACLCGTCRFFACTGTHSPRMRSAAKCIVAQWVTESHFRSPCCLNVMLVPVVHKRTPLILDMLHSGSTQTFQPP